MADGSKTLRAGFTGAVNEEKLNVAERARNAAAHVRDEATAVAETARDNPTVAGSALLAAGVIGFVLGYLVGTTPSRANRLHFW